MRAMKTYFGVLVIQVCLATLALALVAFALLLNEPRAWDGIRRSHLRFTGHAYGNFCRSGGHHSGGSPVPQPPLWAGDEDRPAGASAAARDIRLFGSKASDLDQIRLAGLPTAGTGRRHVVYENLRLLRVEKRR